MDELISVIIPVYNVEKYLLNCINSIIEQTYKKLEILLIDDGSTDESGNLCDEIEKTDARIKVYHKENGGLSDARNYGIKKANGAFYAFIDSDDVLHKDFFSELIKTQRKYNSDITTCDLTLFNDLGQLPQLLKMHYHSTTKLFMNKEALKEYFLPSEERIIHHGLCMKIYRRELFNNLAFKRGKLHEDLYITYRLIDKCNKLVYVDCPYYFYYQGNMESICKTYGVKNFLDEAEAYNQIYNYFACQNRVTDELIHFLIIQYLLMLEKGYKIRKNHEILVQVKQLKKWIDNNVGKCSSLNLIKKILIHISVRDIRIYTFLKKIRGR